MSGPVRDFFDIQDVLGRKRHFELLKFLFSCDEEKTTLPFFKILKDHLGIDDIEETGNMEGRVG
jgi:hypothetical protein